MLMLSLAACTAQEDDNEAEHVDLLTAFEFANGNQEWKGGISDFPIDYLDSVVYKINNEAVPNSLTSSGKALNISAVNPHRDLFYYFLRKESGLEPGERYKIDFEFLVYTQLTGKVDGDLYLKLGATNFPPELSPRMSGTDKNIELISLNVDKGDTNSASGTDVVNIGSIKEFTGEKPEVISGNNFDKRIEVVADRQGNVWLIIGVDSGISGQLTFGMAALTVYFRKQN